MTDDRFAFDQFPRANLPVHYNRRQFWSALRMGVEVTAGRTEGGVALTLSELGQWPDERIFGISPVVVPGCEITVKAEMVWGKPSSASAPVSLFPLDSPALSAFNLFNGLNTLDEVSHALAETMGWDIERAFAYARGLFLSLVMAGVCIPKY